MGRRMQTSHISTRPRKPVVLDLESGQSNSGNGSGNELEAASSASAGGSEDSRDHRSPDCTNRAVCFHF